MKIENICNESITDVAWNISITGGTVFIGKNAADVTNFPSLKTITVFKILLGFGNITITMMIDDCPPYIWTKQNYFCFLYRT